MKCKRNLFNTNNNSLILRIGKTPKLIPYTKNYVASCFPGDCIIFVMFIIKIH